MIQHPFLSKLQKQSYLTIFLLLSFISTVWGNLPDYEIASMNQQQLNLGKLQQYPALIVISPRYETLDLSTRLYQKLYQNLKDQTYLLVSPDLPFYLPDKAILSTLEQKLDDETKSGVLLDWKRDVAKHLFSDDSDLPVVLLLEEDGTILGRYHYEFVTDAFEFIAYTFPTLLPFGPTQLWADSSIGFQFQDQENR